MKLKRLVLPSDIPSTLWNSSKNILELPMILSDVWIKLLEYADIRHLADEPRPKKGPTGGDGLKVTNEHLAWSFTGSAARVQLAMLDPHDQLPHISDAFAKIFSGGRIAIADLPCGSGAATLAILSIVAELRKEEKIPRERLDVVVIGGEVSAFARNYARVGLAYIASALEEQAIFIETQVLEWDVCNPLSNTDLIQKITIRGQGCGARMLVLANFSGFLQTSGKLKSAQPQLNELFRHSHMTNSSAIWIEPQTNSVTEDKSGFFSRIGAWFETAWLSFARLIVPDDSDRPFSTSNAKVKNVLRPESVFDVNLSVIRFDL